MMTSTYTGFILVLEMIKGNLLIDNNATRIQPGRPVEEVLRPRGCFAERGGHLQQSKQ